MTAAIGAKDLAERRNYDWQSPNAANASILLRCLRNTLRLAEGPGEVFGVLRLFWKSLVWRVVGGTDRDHMLRLGGVTHVLGVGTGEVLTPQELYWDQGYYRLPEFIPRDGWVVFDVGANAGVYTVQQARRGARVYAFEPNPDCYRRLTKAIRANNLEDHAVPFNSALGATPGSAALMIPDGLTTMGSLKPAWTPRAGSTGITVGVDTVDRVARRLGIQRIHLLKVDVEGLELDVLHGGRESLAAVERVIVEYHSLELGRRVADLLAEHGLAVVLDETMYRGDEHANPGVGRGLLFAVRRPT